jgi:hypothetical protein
MGFTPNDPWDVKYNKYINKEACREEEEEEDEEGEGGYWGLYRTWPLSKIKYV